MLSIPSSLAVGLPAMFVGLFLIVSLSANVIGPRQYDARDTGKRFLSIAACEAAKPKPGKDGSYDCRWAPPKNIPSPELAPLPGGSQSEIDFSLQ